MDNQAIALRLCPDCGQRTAQLSCPDDGSSTVIVRRYDPSMALKQGDIIDNRYEVGEQLARGGYGAIYSGVHKSTRQEVALKVLRPDFGGPTDSAVRRFFREARVTASLHHPSTVRLFDVGQTDGGAFYIAMERLHGPSLEDVMQRRLSQGDVLSEAEALDVAIPVLRALAEAHGKKLVHRDMKPANIVLADYGAGECVVKLVDFGIALTDGSSLTTTGMALGTPAYMSPEQCEAETIDGRSDLYSLGIILYRCISGDVPFADRNPMVIMQDHLTTRPPDLRTRARTEVSNAFIQVVSTALAKEPADRFASAHAMRQALESVRTQQWPQVAPTLMELLRPEATGEDRQLPESTGEESPRPQTAVVAAVSTARRKRQPRTTANQPQTSLVPSIAAVLESMPVSAVQPLDIAGFSSASGLEPSAAVAPTIPEGVPAHLAGTTRLPGTSQPPQRSGQND